MAYAFTQKARPHVDGLKYLNIATAATTDVVDGPCFLGRIVINGGTLTGTITIYDEAGSATTTKVATIGANQVLGTTYHYNVHLNKGLRIVASANVDFTVCFA